MRLANITLCPATSDGCRFLGLSPVSPYLSTTRAHARTQIGGLTLQLASKPLSSLTSCLGVSRKLSRTIRRALLPAGYYLLTPRTAADRDHHIRKRPSRRPRLAPIEERS